MELSGPRAPSDAPPSAERWSVALFAHNAADTIADGLASLLKSAGGVPVTVQVLAHGCRDRTEAVVAEFAAHHPAVVLHSIKQADRATVWNHYVQDLAPDAGVHFFANAEATSTPLALEALATTLEAVPSLNAVGAVPASGRSPDSWRRHMVRHSTLSGNLYALRGSFVDRVRAAGLRLPRGILDEELAVSMMVQDDLGEGPSDLGPTRLGFNQHAGFAARALSPKRPVDWLRYVQGKWRYRLRCYQLDLLTAWLQQKGWAELPETVEQLYAWPERLPHLSWYGRDTPFAWLALRHMKRARRRQRT